MSVVEDYAASITELTFNSRPIIDTLTTIARENTEEADGILNVITSRIYKCIPEQKLFALYLLDSICKTVGNPYNILIGDDIFQIFSKTYLLVNDGVRQKMTNLFETWKTTKTKGTNLPLFPREQLDKIQGFLEKAGYSRKPQLTNTTLINDIDTLIPIFEGKFAALKDAKVGERVNALKQLRTLLSSQQMKPAELQAVQTHIASIKQQELTPVQDVVPHSNESNEKVAPLAHAEEVFNLLIMSGLVNVEQDLKLNAKPKYEVVLPKVKFSAGTLDTEVSEEEAQLRGNDLTEFDKIRTKELVKISKKVSDLQKFVNTNQLEPSSIHLLYETKASKCGTCGKRFTTDMFGANKKRLHLDWHFRINKKLTSGASVQSRNWYLDDYDWVKFRDDDLLEYSTIKDEVHEDVAEDHDTYIVIPLSEKNMNNTCVICRETIKATYNDDLGEWCWYNCVQVPNDATNRKIMHRLCFNETSRKRGGESLSGVVKRERVA